MNSTELLRSEVSHYLILADTLKERYGELDDETLKDTLEGISDLPEAVAAVIRSSLDDEAYILGLKSRLDDLQARLARLRERYEKSGPWHAGRWLRPTLRKSWRPTFPSACEKVARSSRSSTRGAYRDYFVPQPAKLDRKGLIEALKRGEMVNGALLVLVEPTISVRVR